MYRPIQSYPIFPHPHLSFCCLILTSSSPFKLLSYPFFIHLIFLHPIYLTFLLSSHSFHSLYPIFITYFPLPPIPLSIFPFPSFYILVFFQVVLPSLSISFLSSFFPLISPSIHPSTVPTIPIFFFSLSLSLSPSLSLSLSLFLFLSLSLSSMPGAAGSEVI